MRFYAPDFGIVYTAVASILKAVTNVLRRERKEKRN